MLEDLKEQVRKANLELVNKGVVINTWGNASGISDDRKYIVIKPSGVPYEGMAAEDMVVVEILTGLIIEGKYKPSSDTPTHIELYKAFPDIRGVVHTHSTEAVAWAQAGRDIPLYGTTHADHFFGSVPCTRALSSEEIAGQYEKNTGKVIVETFMMRKIKAMDVPGVLCRNHGPFVWGKGPDEAVQNAVVLEEIAKMARYTEMINPKAECAADSLIEKHYYRKHGATAYYGQV